MLVEEILVQAIAKTLSCSDRIVSELAPLGLQVIPNLAGIIRTRFKDLPCFSESPSILGISRRLAQVG